MWKFPDWLRSSVAWQPVEEHIHSVYGDENVLLCSLWWSEYEAVVKSGKVSNSWLNKF